jgi:serine/threonine-protein kinase HipA
VSPAYDLLCTRYYNDREMALAIDGRKTAWDRNLLLSVGSKLNIPRRHTNNLIDNLLAKLDDLPEQILGGALPFPRHLNIEVANFLKNRHQALKA